MNNIQKTLAVSLLSLSLSTCAFSKNAVYHHKNIHSVKKNKIAVKKLTYVKNKKNVVTPKHEVFIKNDDSIKTAITVNDGITFDDLVALSKNPHPDGVLGYKLQKVLTTPIVDNTINPNPSSDEKYSTSIGDYIRVASWNIERGLNLDNIKLLFSNDDELLKKVNPKANKIDVEKEANQLKQSDIIVMNEVDDGMPRTGYRNVAKELAETLHYNYAYAPEFLEVDPAHLGEEDCQWSEEKYLFPDKKYEVDKSKYKGLHGNAILSKYPLENVRIVRLPAAYDWFQGERDKVTELETARREAAKVIFKEEMLREIRQGGRMAIIADVVVPKTNQKITVVAAHIENRTTPARRLVQLKAILDDIKDVHNPVIFAGDFNTTISDGSPTSVKKEVLKRITDPEFIARNAIMTMLPLSYVVNISSLTGNFVRKYTDPTVKNIPVIAPNKERSFFNTLRKFTFNDGYQFDFRGEKNRTRKGENGLIAQSNERQYKGFVPTYVFERPLVLGRYKLDWIFVKSFSEKSTDDDQSFKLAPHFGSTLRALNYSFTPILSDHAPITADLPLNEPPKHIKREKSIKTTKENK